MQLVDQKANTTAASKVIDGSANTASKVDVFVYDPDTSTVKRRALTMAGIRENSLLVVDGMSVGDRVASARVSFLSAGQLDAIGTNLILEANGDVLTKVQSMSGFVRLRDLMTVRRGYAEPRNKPVYFNGQDIQKIGVALNDRVRQFEQTQPFGISYSFSTFQETVVTESINAALVNVLQTIGVVVPVMTVFLGMRVAFVIAVDVPFTLMFV